jgi:hypothetical protein
VFESRRVRDRGGPAAGERGARLTAGDLLERARTPPASRLAGRLIDRVLGDLFLIQERVMSEPADRAD